jgi:diguanylate cyclase
MTDATGKFGGSASSLFAMACFLGLIALSLVGIGAVIGVEALRGWNSQTRTSSKQPPITIRVEAAGLQLESEAAAILKLVRSYIESSHKYSDTLANAGKTLPASADADQVRSVVQFLIAENEKMQRDAADLRRNLEQSRSQIEKLRSNLAEAEELGLSDALTSVGNRRCFDRILAKEISVAHANGTTMCLVMGDIDHFKRINDIFGHLVGDEVLRMFARLLVDNVKSGDTVARYGGEEFAIILPQTELEEAKQLTERIRKEFEEKRLVVNECGRQIGTITASFGIAQLAEGDDPETLIQRADDKLFEAKHAGRNRVAMDNPIAA